MCDMCDVLRLSYSSADVINHALCDYGEESMGNGIRKLAGEMLMVGSREGYNLGYGDGFSTGHSAGIVKGSIAATCAVTVIAVGAWCINKVVKAKRKDTPKASSDGIIEEV